MVRCRTMSDHNITGDTVKTVRLEPDSPHTLSFPAGEALTSALVSVWRQEDTVWHLWAEVECDSIQGIAFTLAFKGLHGTAPIQRLEPYMSYEKKHPKVTARARAVQSVTRRHYESSMVGGADVAPWSSSVNRLQGQVRTWFKPPSGAHFFPHGQGPKEGLGLLVFAEWFKSLLGGPDLGRVVIADPFFDALGVDHIVGAEVVGLHCQIITHAELTTSDETDSAPRAPGELSPRARRLQRACSKHQPYLSGIRFEILDLRHKLSTGKSPRPIFHDRMLVRLDKQGTLLDAYHLSNSLQSAAANFPLLVTPIPSDALTHVWTYIQELERGRPPLRDPDAYEVVKLVDTGARPEPPALDEEERARQANLLWSQAHVSPDDARAFTANLPQLMARLEAADDEVFFGLWTALSAWVYNSTLWSEAVTGLAQSAPLKGKLKSYLAEYPAEAESGVDESVVRALNFLCQPFSAALQPAPEHLLDQLLDVRFRAGKARGVKLAAHVLLQGAPEDFVHALGARSRKPNSGGPAAAVMLSRLAEHLPFAKSALLRALHQSEVPALRALSVMHLPTVQRRDEPLDLERALKHLDLLPNEEQAISLAYWLGSLGLTGLPKSDLDQMRLGNHRLELRPPLYRELSRRWRPLDKADLQRIVLMLNLGRVGCAWAITRDLLLPLIEQEKLSYEQVSDLWVDNLLEPLEAALSADAYQVPHQSAEELDELVSSIAFAVARTSAPSPYLERIQTLFTRAL